MFILLIAFVFLNFFSFSDFPPLSFALLLDFLVFFLPLSFRLCLCFLFFLCLSLSWCFDLSTAFFRDFVALVSFALFFFFSTISALNSSFFPLDSFDNLPLVECDSEWDFDFILLSFASLLNFGAPAGWKEGNRHLQDLKLQSGEQCVPLGQQCQLSAQFTASGSIQQPYPVKDNKFSQHVVRVGHRVTISGQNVDESSCR